MNYRVAVAVVLLVLLMLVNTLWPASPPPFSASSFGKSGIGHAALFDLLVELDLNGGRSLESIDRLTGQHTLWWVDPLGVCDGRIAMRGEVDVLDPEAVAWKGGPWIAEGGVGVVFLQSAAPGGFVTPEQEELVLCDAIAGFALPYRSPFALHDGSSAGQQSNAARRLTESELRSRGPLAVPEDALVVSGRATLEPRRLALGTAFAFDDALDWEVAAEITAADGRSAPFVLVRAVGAGQLVVVADSGFTHNRWLDAAEAAPLAVDFVRHFGVPRFDEREHGFLPETSAIRYLARSAAWPIFVGLAVLGLLYAWRGAALPARSVEEFDPATPTLETFVSSMAALYAGTRDHGEVLARYRELVAGRIRRHLGLPPEVSRDALAERIRRAVRGAPAVLARLEQLTETRQVESEAELAAAIRDLDQLAREITH